MHEIPHSTFSNLLILGGILIFFVLDRVLSHNHSSKKIENEKEKKELGKKGKNTQNLRKEEKNEVEIKSHHEESALLLLMADFLHNATDGMAIGASYAINPTLGISTTIAIFLHEIAHEVGDFIAFLKFGVSLTRALCMNLLTGLGSLIGTLISLYYGSTDTLTRIVLPIIAGNFLYVSMISMLAPMKKQKKSLIIWEVFFFCSGVGLMVMIEEL
jgi:zinc transporter 7